ncbi:MAG: RNA-binding S4 domain-containing protein [Thermoanaerobaculia bacterium]
MADDSSTRHRIDLWLKHACLVRHRADATEGCKGGLIKVNDRRVKPSVEVQPGDVVELIEPRYRKVVVLAVPGRQASKEEARELYRDETPPPPPVPRPPVERERGAGRPTKRERRELERWKTGR